MVLYFFYLNQDEINLKLNIPASLYNLLDKTDQKSIEIFSVHQVNLLDSLFSIITRNKHFRDLDVKIAQLLIDVSLNVLYDVIQDTSMNLR